MLRVAKAMNLMIFLMDTSAVAATSGHCLMSESINHVSSCCY